MVGENTGRECAHLVHGVNEPLSVGRKAFCQVTDALHDISLDEIIVGGPQILYHLLHNDLRATAWYHKNSQTCASKVTTSKAPVVPQGALCSATAGKKFSGGASPIFW